MKKLQFSIGSNNITHKLEKAKALSILSGHYEGLTAIEVTGYWQGQPEKTLQVSIVVDHVTQSEVDNVCSELNRALDQQAIMVEISDSNTQFISSR